MLLLAAAVAAVLSVLIHELGHLAGAWAAGFRVDAFQCFGVGWRRTPQGGTLRLSPSFLDSFVQPSAVDLTRARRGVFAVVIGGPAASAMLTLCAALAAAVWPGLWTVSIVWMSAAVLTSSLVPSIRRGFVSDGLRLWRLWQHPAELDSAARGLVANWFEATTSRPREWDMDVLADLVLDPDALTEDRETATGEADQRVRELQLAYFALLDRGRFVYAGLVCAAMVEASKNASPHIRRSALFEAGWFKAIHCQDLGGARQAINSALVLSGSEGDLWLGLRARAAVWRETGRREQSAELAKEALEHAPADSPINCFRRETLEWMARVPQALAAGA